MFLCENFFLSLKHGKAWKVVRKEGGGKMGYSRNTRRETTVMGTEDM